MFSCECFEIFQNNFLYRTLPVAASNHSSEKNHLGSNLLELLRSYETSRELLPYVIKIM